jgi:phage shock protein A
MKKEENKIEKYVLEKTFNTFEERFDKFEERFDEFEERFESSARATAKSFSDNAEVTAEILSELKNIKEVSTITLKEIKNINEENKYFRQSISSLNMNDFSCDKKIENLTLRVEKLENVK